MMIHENKHGNIVKLCLQSYSREKRCFLICGSNEFIVLNYYDWFGTCYIDKSRNPRTETGQYRENLGNSGPDQQKIETSDRVESGLVEITILDRNRPTWSDGQQKFENLDRTGIEENF